MRVRLEYGREGLDVDLPDERVVHTLAYRDAVPLADPEVSLRQALLAPTGTPPVAALARGRRTACILVCDITRPVPNQLLLPPLLEELQAGGLRREDILILVATGLHRPNDRDELVEMLGRRIVSEYRVENHHGRRQEDHTFLGTSPRGVPIWVDTRYCEADLKITTGLIEPHFMAGFSGGRKLVCPGICGIETIRAWHGPEFLEHPRADIGVLEGNPVHEENTWIARHAGCDLIVNVVIDSQRRPLRFAVGDMVEAFENGVDFVRELVTDHVPHPVDVVVTSSAGYPLDTTFYQSVKGMVGALPIVRPGGTIVIAASMSEGIGSPEFTRLFDENESLESFMRRITTTDYFVMDQWQMEELAKVRRKAKVKVVSDGLSEEAIKRLFVDAAPTVEKALSESLRDYGDDAEIAVIPKGPYVIAQVAENG